MRKLYEVVYYSGDMPFPAYYVVNQIECENLEEELKSEMPLITQRVRQMFSILEDVPDYRIHEALYVLQEDRLTSLNIIS
jgi:hypothetical protein